MILGDTCTRSCGYCNVTHGTPTAARRRTSRSRSRAPSTPWRSTTSSSPRSIATICRTAAPSHFARDHRARRGRASPQCRIEVLIPDFKGDEAALRTVLDARPGRAQPQHRDGAAPLSHGAAGRPLRARAAAARSLARLRAGHPDQVRADGRARRGVGRGRRRRCAISRRPAARSSPSASTCGRRSPTCRCRATTRRPSSPS